MDRGWAILKCVRVDVQVDDVTGGGFRITTPERVYALQAENHESKLLWVQALVRSKSHLDVREGRYDVPVINNTGLRNQSEVIVCLGAHRRRRVVDAAVHFAH
jgi:hypothetical protein